MTVKENRGSRSSAWSLGWFAGLLLVSATSVVSGQSTVTRYLPINGSIMPFSTLVAPLETIALSADTEMHYNAVVTTVNVSWSVVSDTNNYKLELRNLVTNAWQEIYDGPSNLYIVDNLDIGQRYFRVTACGDGLCGDPSHTASAIVEENYDADQDGIIDQLDLCPNSAENAVITAHGCVATTADTDLDGVTDDLDWCVDTNPQATDIDDRGCTPDQTDSDDDGTPDYLDSYPYQHDTQCTA